MEFDFLLEAYYFLYTEDLVKLEKDYKNALKTNIGHGKLYLVLALIMYKKANLSRAMSLIEKGLLLNSNDQELLLGKAFILINLKKYDEALKIYKSENNKKSTAEIMTRIGVVYKFKKDIIKAEEYYLEALDIDDNYLSAHLMLGELYLFNNPKKALFHYSRGLYKENAKSRFNIGNRYLLLGEYELGWLEYEYRLQLKNRENKSLNNLPNKWTGENDKNSSILIICEQGYGDSIQFIRFIPLVALKFKSVSVICPQALIYLFKENFPNIKFYSNEENPNIKVDFQVPLMSLGLLLSINLDLLENIKQPYLNILSPKKLNSNNIKVGFSWAGRAQKSMSLKQLSKLFKLPNIDFYSIKKDDEADELSEIIKEYNNVFDLSNKLKNFYDTASYIKSMDLVITVDTSVAHLAGSLGIDTFTMLPYLPDWRWLLDKSDTPWYNSMTLFRKKEDGTWDEVIEQIRKILGVVTSSSHSLDSITRFLNN